MGSVRTVLSLLFAGLVSTSWAAVESSCEPAFIDDFSSGLDGDVWSVTEGDGCDIGLCGWGNNEIQMYTDSAIKVRDGHLQITAFEEDGILRSGKLTTSDSFGQRYGRFEARIKLPGARGLWPAFWLMPRGSEQPWPRDGEIDIMEWAGNEPHRLIGAAHFGDVRPNNVHYSETLRLPGRWDDDFHVFAVEWRADEIRWLVDERVHSVMSPDAIAPWPWVFDRLPFFLILNVAVGGTLGGQVFPEDLPATMLVDWVKVYPEACLTE